MRRETACPNCGQPTIQIHVSIYERGVFCSRCCPVCNPRLAGQIKLDPSTELTVDESPDAETRRMIMTGQRARP